EVLGILYFFVNDVYTRFPYQYSVTSFILNASLYLAIKTPPKVSFITLTSGGRYRNKLVLFYSIKYELLHQRHREVYPRYPVLLLLSLVLRVVRLNHLSLHLILVLLTLLHRLHFRFHFRFHFRCCHLHPFLLVVPSFVLVVPSYLHKLLRFHHLKAPKYQLLDQCIYLLELVVSIDPCTRLHLHLFLLAHPSARLYLPFGFVQGTHPLYRPSHLQKLHQLLYLQPGLKALDRPSLQLSLLSFHLGLCRHLHQTFELALLAAEIVARTLLQIHP